MLRIATAATGLLMLVSCTGGESTAPDSYDTVQDIVDAMDEGGLKCTDVRVDDEEPVVKQFGSCKLHGEKYIAFTILEDEDKDQIHSVFKAQLGHYGGTYVVGDTWTVRVEEGIAEDEKTAKEIQDAIGGEIEGDERRR